MNLAQRLKTIIATAPGPEPVQAAGWLRSCRNSKSITFLDLYDGSCQAGLQVVAANGLDNYESEVKKLSTGCAIQVTGVLQESPAAGQAVELHATALEVVGWAHGASYPLQKKRHSMEFLRSIPHLRGRTNSMGAMMRIRNALTFGVHTFFQQRGFLQLHTPIITSSDCEGAGEMFTVTSLTSEQLAEQAKEDAPFNQDFFGQKVSLTVSGQLEAEAYALAMGPVYTFGPTFRAENSHTSRHLAEFWMVEPEIPFCDLDQDMDIAEEMLRFLVATLLDQCPAELEFFNRFVDKGLTQRLKGILANSFTRLTYSEAIAELQRAETVEKFAYPVTWGMDLQSEHEKFLAEQICKSPVIVRDYPTTIKPFYMRANDDDKTVAAMDILVPGIGEIIGGSQREERLDILTQRMAAQGVAPDEYEWYLDLRRFGSVPHAGFGLGFERLLLLTTGLTNIRDVIAFPRTPGQIS
ncbi:MAG: asparagine--tRNA ligase [Thermodesulfobacteriota bacterium]